jgi:hypothetical protein
MIVGGGVTLFIAVYATIPMTTNLDELAGSGMTSGGAPFADQQLLETGKRNLPSRNRPMMTLGSSFAPSFCSTELLALIRDRQGGGWSVTQLGTGVSSTLHKCFELTDIKLYPGSYLV